MTRPGSFGGGKSKAYKPSSFNLKAKPPGERVVLTYQPPFPVGELAVPYKTARAVELRQVAMSCRLENNWGCFQLHGDKWTTEHRDSTAAAPRLNCDPV